MVGITFFRSLAIERAEKARTNHKEKMTEVVILTIGRIG